ncbi:MAG: hypothetical protein AMJ94_16505 [Deltaproteobacteria bacterium SM23_61]|nr:MAG: hypothetical protein AMJ94_16505 [Deltaproteobacteria bacterium SM23_61]
MGKVPTERGDGTKSPRLFFLGGPFFPLDMTGGEKVYGGKSRGFPAVHPANGARDPRIEG